VSGSQGRDWFDLEWYVRRGIPLHLEHVAERARQSGPLAPSASLQRRYAPDAPGRANPRPWCGQGPPGHRALHRGPESLAICSHSYFQQLALGFSC